MQTGKLYIYKRFERFWHWTQAGLILFLAFTGFEVHGTFEFFGYEKAVVYHRYAARGLIGLILFAVFWHFTTGEWRQYIPTTKKLRDQIMYYTSGIFKGAPHPTRKTMLKKLNPLQILVYLGFKLVLVPLVLITGLLYMNHKSMGPDQIVEMSGIPLGTVAQWHTLGAYLLISFLVVHVYMTTTGTTLTSNIKAMITGYDHEGDAHTGGTERTDPPTQERSEA